MKSIQKKALLKEATNEDNKKTNNINKTKTNTKSYTNSKEIRYLFNKYFTHFYNLKHFKTQLLLLTS